MKRLMACGLGLVCAGVGAAAAPMPGYPSYHTAKSSAPPAVAPAASTPTPALPGARTAAPVPTPAAVPAATRWKMPSAEQVAVAPAAPVPVVPPHPATVAAPRGGWVASDAAPAAVAASVAASPGCAGVSQPLPAVLAATLPTVPTVPPPGSYQLAGCADGACRVPTRGGGRSCLRAVADWLAYRPGPPVIEMCVPTPYHAPLRAYFPCTPGCDAYGTCGLAAGCGAAAGEQVQLPDQLGPRCGEGCQPVRGRLVPVGGLANLLSRRTDAYQMNAECGAPAGPPAYLRGACPPSRLGLFDRVKAVFSPSYAAECYGTGPVSPEGVMAGYTAPPGYTATGVVIHGTNTPFSNP